MDKRKSMLERKSTSVILSVTSLVLIVCLLVVATYSWVDTSKVDTVQTNEMSLNLDTGLDQTSKGLQGECCRSIHNGGSAELTSNGL